MEGRKRAQKIFPAPLLAVEKIRERRPNAPKRQNDVAARTQHRIDGTRNDDRLEHVPQSDADDAQAAGEREKVEDADYGEALAPGVGVSAGIGVASPGVGVGVGGGGAVGPPVTGTMRR